MIKKVIIDGALYQSPENTQIILGAKFGQKNLPTLCVIFEFFQRVQITKFIRLFPRFEEKSVYFGPTIYKLGSLKDILVPHPAILNYSKVFFANSRTFLPCYHREKFVFLYLSLIRKIRSQKSWTQKTHVFFIKNFFHKNHEAQILENLE